MDYVMFFSGQEEKHNIKSFEIMKKTHAKSGYVC
jgi:hypothetical protein